MCRWKTLCPASGPTLVTRRQPLRSMPSVSARCVAACAMSASISPWRSSMSAIEAMCSFGISRMWVGALASVSGKATIRSFSCTISVAISCAAILQKTQVVSMGASLVPRPTQRAVGRRGLVAERGEPLEERAFLSGKIGRRDDVQRHVQVAAATPLQVRHTLALEPHDRARRRPRLDSDLHVAVEARHGDVGAERRLCDRDVEHGMEILVPALEGLRRLNLELDEEVARRAARDTRVPRSLDAQLHPVGNTGRDVEHDVCSRRHPTGAATRLARVGDLLTRALARDARRRRHQRAEDASARALDLPGASAGAACDRRGTGLCAVAETGLADRQPFELDLATQPEGCVAEPEAQAHGQVLTAARATARAATPSGAEPAHPAATEEHLEDLGQIREATARRAVGAAERVVARALVGVGQDLVVAGDLLEPLVGSGVAAHVGVMLPSEGAIRTPDLLVGRVTADAKDLVEVADGRHQRSASPDASVSRSATARTAVIAAR